MYKYLNNYCTSDVFAPCYFLTHALRRPREALTHLAITANPRTHAFAQPPTHARTHTDIRPDIITLISCTLLKCLPITRCVSINVFIYVYICMYIYIYRRVCIYRCIYYIKLMTDNMYTRIRSEQPRQDYLTLCNSFNTVNVFY